MGRNYRRSNDLRNFCARPSLHDNSTWIFTLIGCDAAPGDVADHRIDDAKKIHLKAEAFRTYAKLAGEPAIG
jgi:hypothetical protein